MLQLDHLVLRMLCTKSEAWGSEMGGDRDLPIICTPFLILGNVLIYLIGMFDQVINR